jgi:hypothetical protein
MTMKRWGKIFETDNEDNKKRFVRGEENTELISVYDPTLDVIEKGSRRSNTQGWRIRYLRPIHQLTRQVEHYMGIILDRDNSRQQCDFMNGLQAIYLDDRTTLWSLIINYYVPLGECAYWWTWYEKNVNSVSDYDLYTLLTAGRERKLNW